MKKQILLFLCLLSPWLAQAQTGPAGIGNATGASGQPENILWLRAADLGLANGDSITTWADQSGNGNDMVQQGADDVPFFRNDGLSGTYDVVRFDGTERYLVLADNADLDDNMSGLTMMIVTRITGIDGSARGILSKRNGSNSQDSYSLFTHTGQHPFFDVGAGGSNSRLDGGVGLNGTTDYLFSGVYDGTTQSLFVQSTLEASKAKTSNVDNTTSSLYMGALNNNYGTYFNGDIAEVILYKDALNGAQRIIVENYLSQKYGITISNDYFASGATNYDDDLRGIGTANGTDKVSVSEASDALTVEELNGSLNTAGEFVMVAHDSTVTHTSDTETADTSDSDITSRWNKDYYIESTGGVSTKLRFDFGDAVYTFGAASEYVLLYRADTTGEYSRVPAINYTQENSDQLVVELTAGALKNGYYTVGRGTQVVSQTWYVQTNGDWEDSTTWTLDASTTPFPDNPSNETPDQYDEIVIRNGKSVFMTADNKTILGAKVDGLLEVKKTTGHDFGVIEGTGRISIEGNGGSGNFPAGTVTTLNGFADPANGGTLLVEGTGFTFNTDREFNNVRVQLTNPTDVVSLGADMTMNGDFTVRNGTFQFGDVTTDNRTLDVFGDVLVENNGSTRDGRIATANADARHEFSLRGDFRNDGDNVAFTQRNAQTVGSEATTGIVDVNLVSTTQDQTVSCNGVTNFYRIEINKGAIDVMASIEASAAGNFNLYGFANDDTGGDITAPGQNDNALGLITGTVKIGTNVTVNPLNNTGNYSVGSNARLWIDGGIVTKTGGAAITPYGTIEISAGTLEVPSGSGITTRESGQIVVSGGAVWVSQIRTSVFGAGAQGGYEQSGGTVNVWDYSVAESPILGQGAGTADNNYSRFCLTYEGNSFIMSGGTLNVKDATGGVKGGLIFINSDPGNINVTGGTVNAYSTNGNNSKIASTAPFWDLNIINETTNTAAKVTSETATAGPGGTDDDRTITDPDLKVLNDLTIQTGTTRTNAGGDTYGGYLDLVPDNTNPADLYVDGDLTIEDNAVLDVWGWTGSDNSTSATLYFNGSSEAVFHIGDITSYSNALLEYEAPNISEGGPDGNFPSTGTGEMHTYKYNLPLYNLIVDKPDGKLSLAANNPGKGGSWGNAAGQAGNWVCSNGGKNTRRWLSQLLSIKNQFKLLNGTFSQIDPNNTVTIVESGGGTYGTVGDPVGYSVNLYTTDVEIRDTMFVYQEGSTPKEGIIEVRAPNPLNLQTTENAFIGNMRLIDDYNNPVTLVSDVHFGRIEYANGTIDIGTNNLKIDLFETYAVDNSIRMDAVAGGQPVFGVPNFIRMAGNASDGGLSLKVPKQPTWPLPNNDEFEYLLNSWDEEQGPYAFPDRLWFPIGTDASGSDKYTPAVCEILNNGTTDGDEYITVRVVDQELQTTDLSGGDVLSYYWNVDFEGYAPGQEPTVSWMFQYDDADLDVGSGDASLFVPGKVEDGGAYLRSDEGGMNAVKDGGASAIEGNILGNDPRNIIIFNGVGTNASTVAADDIESISSTVFDTDATGPNINTNWQNAWPNTGFTLENANYTAGVAARFVGEPRIFYSRGVNFQWNQNTSWSTTGFDGVAATGFPDAGDIAIIGFDDNETPLDETDDSRHVIRVENYTVQAAELIFQSPVGATMLAENLATINLRNSAATLDVGAVSGKGWLQFQESGTFPVVPSTVDLGAFVSNDSSAVLYNRTGGGSITIDAFEVYPTLRLFADGANTSIDKNVRYSFNRDIIASSLIIDGNAALEVNNNITVSEAIYLGRNRDGELIFDNGNVADTVTTKDLFIGDMIVNAGENINGIKVDAGGGNNIAHTLEVSGNISWQYTGQPDNGSFFSLINGAASDNDVILNLTGSGISSLDIDYTGDPGFETNGINSTMELYRIKLDKGVNTSSIFTFNDEFNIPDADTTASFQPIEVLNGTLVLNSTYNGGAGILLATDGSNFLLPNTANPEASSGSGGLEIRQGTARIEGNNTGMILDGPLTISGGTLDMDSTGTFNGNNFIQYSASGNASINVTAGTLDVGSQVRRGLTSVAGALNYSQTGGVARFGINTAPESDRGVFEILNAGSSFTHTAGDFIVVRQNGSSTVGSLIMKPETYNFAGSTITIGDASTPAGQTNIGIDANVPMNTLLVTNNNSLVAKTFVNPLVVNNLNIQNNATYDANGLNLTVNTAMNNDGVFTTSGNSFNDQITFFPTSGTMNINGTGTSTFWQLHQTGVNSTLNVNKEITIEEELLVSQSTATFATGANAVNLKGDVRIEGTQTNDVAAPGLVFNGSDVQNIARLSPGNGNLGTITVDNANGVNATVDGHYFIMDHKVVLSAGVLDIGPNLMILDETAIVENATGGVNRTDFSANNMITVNTSIKDLGLRKVFPDSYTGTFTYPIGLSFYTPVEITVDGIAGTTANTGYITVKPIDDITPGLEEDDDADTTCGSPVTDNYPDDENVLNYYWLLKSANVGDFDGGFKMYYASDTLIQENNSNGLTAVDNYAPARLMNSDSLWQREFPRTDFNTTDRSITFTDPLGGNYTGLVSSSIQGRYTAGLLTDDGGTLLCGTSAAIPERVPEYVTDGSQDEVNFTATVYDTTLSADGANPPAPGISPDLRIASGDELVMNRNLQRFRKVTIESGAVLVVPSGINVNLGTIIGEGGQIKIRKNNTTDPNFPSGDYDEYFPSVDCDNGFEGGLVYENTATANGTLNVLNAIPAVFRLTLQGNGTKVLSNNSTVCENLEIGGGVFDMGATAQTLTVIGNITKDDALATFDDSDGTTVLKGTAQQLIDGDFTGLQSFKNLTVDNANGMTVVNGGNDDVEVSGTLAFTNGIITTNADNDLIISQGGTLSGYSASRYVNGPLVRTLAAQNNTFDFPVGSGGRYGRMALVNTTGYTSGPSTRNFKVTYTGTSNTTYGEFRITSDAQNAGVKKASGNEYWTINSQTTDPSASDVMLYWDGQSDVQSTIGNLMAVVWDPAGTNNVPPGGVGAWDSLKTTSNPDGSVTSGNMQAGPLSYSEKVVTFGSTDETITPLPVELLDFTAKRFGEDEAEVLWTTATEFNNSHFVVEHSLDGQEFQAVGQVEGAGNSYEMRSYRFVHEEPQNGVNYYRLKQVDHDGTFSYSKVASVTMEGVEEDEDKDAARLEPAVSVFPNPIRTGYELGVEAKNVAPKAMHQVELVDLTGRILTVQVDESDANGTLSAQLSVGSELETGLYIIRITDGNRTFTKKVSVIK